MSMNPAEYTFVPWVREGYRPTDDDAAPGEVAVQLTVDASGEQDLDPKATVETTLSLYGPGEVTGIDRRQVVRTDPASGTTDFPPNYFPAVEFDRPDLPWLFSPAADDEDGRVTPWLTLVVVADRAGVSLTTGADTPASVLSITSPADPAAQLPDLSDAWAWAHAQTVGADDATAELRTDRSAKTLSRLVSPRNLAPSTEYLACVVPTYEPGRLAGLGEDPTDGEGRTFEFAWTADAMPGSIRLPVYYHWRFSTGEAGDFESLVRRLGPETLTDLGVRSVDAGDPGPASLERPGETVSVEGALRSTDVTPDPYDAGLRAQLESILDQANALTAGSGTDDGDPVLGPPTYGQWPPAAPEVPDQGMRPAWLRDLNVDPRWRVPAGFGTDVVQDRQEHLMRNAWEQVGDIRRANQLLRRARLARAASQSIHDDIAALDPIETLLVTEPLHARLTETGETIAGRIEDSSLSSALLSPAFRRVTRPNGPLARRFGGLSTAKMVDAVATGPLDPGDDDAPPDGTQTLDDELAADLCTAARETARTSETWHPLGDEATRDSAVALERARAACREFRAVAAEFVADLRGTPFASDLDAFVEPLMGVCEGPDEDFETDLDQLATALGSDEWGAVNRVTARILRAFAQATEGHEALQERATPGDPLDVALTDDPAATPAFERFRSRFYRLVLLVFERVFWDVCETARGHLHALTKANPEHSQALAELRAICTALCGDGDKPGGLLARIARLLERGDARALRTASGSLQQLLAMATARVDALTEKLASESRDADLDALSLACRRAQRYADVLRVRLADAPWSLAADAVGQAACPRPEPAEPPPLNAAAIAESVITATDPATTVPARVADRLGGIDLTSRDDPLVQILAHPEFKQPMYEPLREYDQESLLPGVGEIPGNSVGVLETNPAFIESYMLGLSHEFARELRWREYPTDMRGTFFRQFWDPAGREWPSDEVKRDIDYVHRWAHSLGLGGNYAAKMAAKTGGDSAVGGQLVLLVRGEVFDRYPNTHVYAAKGRRPEQSELDDSSSEPDRVPDLPEPPIDGGSGQAARTGDVKEPVFRGTLDPDVTFFGFDLTESEAVADPGWFFVIEEPPSEPTFGLDVAVSDPDDTDAWDWEDLTWDDVTADGYVSATTDPSGEALPDSLPTTPEWGKNSAHFAEITWQLPYRVAIHADDMIPQGTSQ